MPVDPQHVESIFHRALELAPADRHTFLASACHEDAELRDRVDRLLAAHDLLADSAESRSGAGVPHVTGELDPRPLTEDHVQEPSAGTMLAGKYKLVEEIGEGGMGTVWMAQQTEPVKRVVAIKLIKAGMDSRTVLARFDAERQALALMDHPNIARVLDAGTTLDGRPYFVMELVKGQLITRFCDERKLTLRERLELFVPVCNAIQHAHQKGIIHRDIKPNNVLIALYDDRPVPKVIDFGVAKAIGQPLTEKTLATGFGAVVGTPEYMSPEQASFNNLDIDTRSDVYALGVLLYELLAGSPPFSRHELATVGLLEILRVIREEDPPKPSTKLSTDEALPSLSANRGMEPKHLAALLRGELDWIVMKALEKDRNRRYESANEFGADVQRYLAGDRVQAVPPSALYRLEKFLRRNQGPVVAVSLVLFVLLGGIIGTSWGLVRAQNERTAKAQLADLATAKAAEAGEERDRAIQAEKLSLDRLAVVERQKKEIELAMKQAATERDVARAIARFLQDDLLRYSSTQDQIRSQIPPDREIRVRTLLDRAAERIETGLKDQPAVQAAIHRCIGNTYRQLGEFDKAEYHLRKLGSLIVDTPDGYSRADADHALGALILLQGKPSEAERLLTRAAEQCRQAKGPDHNDTLLFSQDQANALLLLRRFDDAEKIWKGVLEIRRRVDGPRHTETLNIESNLAALYRAQGKFPEAEKRYRELLGRLETDPARNTTFVCIVQSNLGEILALTNRAPEAVSLLNKALATQERLLGREHPDTLTTVVNLAGAYWKLGRLAEAEKLNLQNLAIQERVLGKTHLETLTTLNNLAVLRMQLGRTREGLQDLTLVLERRREVLGEDHPETILVRRNLAVAYYDLHDYRTAEPLLRAALRDSAREHGVNHRDTIILHHNLADSLRHLGRDREGLEYYQAAAERMRRRFGIESPDTRSTMQSWALCLERLDQNAEAEPIWRDLANYARMQSGEDSLEFSAAAVLHSQNLIRQRKHALAEPLLRTALAIRQKRTPNSWITFNVQSYLGAALLGQLKLAEAEPLLLAGYNGMKSRKESIPGILKYLLAEAADRLIGLNLALGKTDDVKIWRAERGQYPPPRAPIPREGKR